MAQIIEMQSFEGRRFRRFDLPSDGAQILFFMGVRYERMPDAPESPATPRSKAPRRRAARKRRA